MMASNDTAEKPVTFGYVKYTILVVMSVASILIWAINLSNQVEGAREKADYVNEQLQREREQIATIEKTLSDNQKTDAVILEQFTNMNKNIDKIMAKLNIY